MSAADVKTIATSWIVRKRNGAEVPFDLEKIKKAVAGCFADTPTADLPADVNSEVSSIAAAVTRAVASTGKSAHDIEHIQRLVIAQLWSRALYSAAEAYQNYREERRKLRSRETAPIFVERKAVKPYEYPELIKFVHAIEQSYWTVGHWKFVADVNDVRVGLSQHQRSVVQNALLAISQIEVDVKTFWAKLGDRFRKPELSMVGMTFADSEVRHMMAYSHLLEILGLNGDFERILTVPAVRSRVDYLKEALQSASTESNRDFVFTLALFSLFTEYVSLFSQFFVIQSFHKHLGVIKDVDSVILATKKEELVHAIFGMTVINHIRDQRPEWFGPEFYEKLYSSCRKAYAAELGIVEWIFDGQDLPFVTRAHTRAVIQHQFNEGLAEIGGDRIFTIDPTDFAAAAWFHQEQHADVSTDFFHKRPVTYSRFTQSATADDLF